MLIGDPSLQTGTAVSESMPQIYNINIEQNQNLNKT